MSGRKHTASSAIVALVAFAAPAVAQQSLTAADGKSSIVPVRYGFLSLDFGQEKVSVRQYIEKVTQAADEAGQTTLCGFTFQLPPNHREWNFELGLAAKQGKSDLFSGGRFVPGADLSVGFAWFKERHFKTDGIDCNGAKDKDGNVSINPESKGYHAFFATLDGNLVNRKTVEAPVAPSETITTADKTGRGVGLSLGYNRAFGSGAVLGLAAKAQRDWTSPGDDDPQNFCINSTTGTDSDGTAALVESCEERFLGPLKDETTGQVRVDYVRRFSRITLKRAENGGPDDGEDQLKGPFLGILAAASSNFRSSKATSYNLALGPTLHPADKPSQLLGAVLFEIKDITKARSDKPLSKRLSLRVHATVPF